MDDLFSCYYVRIVPARPAILKQWLVARWSWNRLLFYSRLILRNVFDHRPCRHFLVVAFLCGGAMGLLSSTWTSLGQGDRRNFAAGHPNYLSRLWSADRIELFLSQSLTIHSIDSICAHSMRTCSDNPHAMCRNQLVFQCTIQAGNSSVASNLSRNHYHIWIYGPCHAPFSCRIVFPDGELNGTNDPRRAFAKHLQGMWKAKLLLAKEFLPKYR